MFWEYVFAYVWGLCTLQILSSANPSIWGFTDYYRFHLMGPQAVFTNGGVISSKTSDTVLWISKLFIGYQCDLFTRKVCICHGKSTDVPKFMGLMYHFEALENHTQMRIVISAINAIWYVKQHITSVYYSGLCWYSVNSLTLWEVEIWENNGVFKMYIFVVTMRSLFWENRINIYPMSIVDSNTSNALKISL